MTFTKILSYLKPHKKGAGKTFFDYSSEDKRKILKRAVEEGGKMQRDLIERYEKSTPSTRLYCK